MSAQRLRQLSRLALRRAALAAALLAALAGCGSVRTSVALNDAEVELEAAREAQAEKLAPYEYTAAEAWLQEARDRQGHSEYDRAMGCAQRALEYANQARRKATGRDEEPAARQQPRTRSHSNSYRSSGDF